MRGEAVGHGNGLRFFHWIIEKTRDCGLSLSADFPSLPSIRSRSAIRFRTADHEQWLGTLPVQR